MVSVPFTTASAIKDSRAASARTCIAWERRSDLAAAAGGIPIGIQLGNDAIRNVSSYGICDCIDSQKLTKSCRVVKIKRVVCTCARH